MHLPPPKKVDLRQQFRQQFTVCKDGMFGSDAWVVVHYDDTWVPSASPTAARNAR